MKKKSFLPQNQLLFDINIINKDVSIFLETFFSLLKVFDAG